MALSDHRKPLDKITLKAFAKKAGYKNPNSRFFKTHLNVLCRKQAIKIIYEVPKKIAIYDWKLIEVEFNRDFRLIKVLKELKITRRKIPRRVLQKNLPKTYIYGCKYNRCCSYKIANRFCSWTEACNQQEGLNIPYSPMLERKKFRTIVQRKLKTIRL